MIIRLLSLLLVCYWCATPSVALSAPSPSASGASTDIGQAAAASSPPPAASVAAPHPEPPPAPVILVLGDSLAAAYGIPREQGWAWLLGERLRELGHPHQVVNASISGETAAGGLNRLPALLERHRPAILLIELGANDGLRGQRLDLIRASLAGLVERGAAAGAQPLLIGVPLPPNYGAAYTQGFQAIFREVAAATGTPLAPNLLDGIAEDRRLMQPDDLHPTAAAQPRMLDLVWPTLEPLLEAGGEH